MSKGKRIGLICLGVLPVVVVILWQLGVTSIAMTAYMLYRMTDPAFQELTPASEAYMQAMQQITEDFTSGKAMAVTTFAIYIGYLIIFGIWFYFMYCRKEKSDSWKQVLKLSGLPCIIGAGIMIQLAMDVILTVAFAMFPALYESYEAVMNGLTGDSVFMVISVCLLAPIGEELIFRGLAMRTMQRAMPWQLALVLQALLFGVYHMNPVQGCYATLFGLCMGYLAYRYGSIIPAIILHIAINSSSYLISWLLSLPAFENEVLFVVVGVISAILVFILLRISVKGVVSPYQQLNESNSTNCD